MQIYENYGYTSRDAVTSILQNNLYGLDIDDRAAQLAYFAVMMKARRYDRRFFSHTTQPHVYAIEESNRIEKPDVEYFCNGKLELKDAMHTILTQLYDAKEYGSILTITPQDWDALYARFDEVADESSFHRDNILKHLLPLVHVAQTLAQKYDVVVTNPPYRRTTDVEITIQDYVKETYPDSYSDLSTVFMERCVNFSNPNGYISMINIPVWMSIASYANLRKKLINNYILFNMLHLGRGVFGSDFGTTAFVFQNNWIEHYKGTYKRLFEKQGAVESESIKHQRFSKNKCKTYTTDQSLYRMLPNTLIAYNASQPFVDAFLTGKNISTYAKVFEGLKTRDKERFLRLWFEVSDCKWKPYAKGGLFRRWYGNTDYVVKWGEAGDEIRNFKKSSGANFQDYFKPEITYSAMTMSQFTGRYINHQLFGGGGGGIVPTQHLMYLLAFVNSKVFDYIIMPMKSTVNFEVGQIGSIPVVFQNETTTNRVETLAKYNVDLSKVEWDFFEYSWDFTRHPFIKAITKYPNMMDIGNIYLAECYDIWAGECEERFEKLKANEEELNRIFIDIYGLQDELTPEVEDKDVTVRKADLGRDVRSFISYAVGCMFGRYSPTYDGLAYAGGTWDDGKYNIYKPDADGIIPICDDEYFEDDMMGHFVEFVRVVYGDSSLEDNLLFIAKALGGKGQPKEVIRNYFLNDFYTDHCKIYQKRPIYWLFDSGKKNGFKCLIYLHRYQPDTIARIRTDYVHEQQARYRTAIEGLEKQVAAATSTSERVKLTKQLNKVQAQDTELHQYEEKVHALADQMIKLDLDDGVKHNYEIFKDVLAKIK